MGMNVPPILINIYMAMLQNEVRCKQVNDPNRLQMVNNFGRFMHTGFGIIQGTKKGVEILD